MAFNGALSSPATGAGLGAERGWVQRGLGAVVVGGWVP